VKDSYEWVQFVEHHADAPDLFYKLTVTSTYDLSELETMMDPERSDCCVCFDSDNPAVSSFLGPSNPPAATD
jgi:hypothetical protein